VKLSAYLLFLQAFFLLYGFEKSAGGLSYIYLSFGVLNVLLAGGLLRGYRSAAKITLIYKGIDLFLAILMLIAGALFHAINAGIDILIIHDLVGLFGKRGEEGE